MDVIAGGDSVSPYESDRDGPGDSSNDTKNTSSTPLSNGDSPSSQEDNKFQSAISAWRSTNRRRWYRTWPS